MIFINNIFKICFVIVGTIIGAGFASGKEIYTFFCMYGIYGLWGILISNGIIGFVIYLTFNIILKNNIKTYSQFSHFLVGNHKLLIYTINNIMNIFLLISFIVMVSGFGAYFKQEFNIPIFLGSVIISLLAFITFFKDINGLVKINCFLIPILIFLIVLLGLKEKIYLFNIHNLSVNSGFSWILKSILYASYNSIVLVPIIINMKNLIIHKKQIKYIICSTLLFMIIMSFVIYVILNLNLIEITNIDIPVIYIANKFGITFKYLYGLVILIAIFTTAISAGYSFLENISKTKKQHIIYSVLICIFSIMCSNIGFSKLLNALYPILGYLGLFQISLLFYNTFYTKFFK